jgi:nicotinamidase-related amidase
MTAYIAEYALTFTLRPATTALLVIDLQNATGSLDHGLAQKLRAEGRLEESKYRFERIEKLVVPNTQKLLAAFRGMGAPVIFITYGAETPDASDVARHIRAFVRATGNIAGRPEHEIVAALKPLPHEPVLNKTTMGAFGSTGIDSRLRALGVTEVVCVGVSTNNCVGMTAMEAADRGYGTVLVSDATGTCSDRMQTAFEEMFLRLWGRVLTTAETTAELRAHASAHAAQ